MIPLPTKLSSMEKTTSSPATNGNIRGYTGGINVENVETPLTNAISSACHKLKSQSIGPGDGNAKKGIKRFDGGACLKAASEESGESDDNSVGFD